MLKSTNELVVKTKLMQKLFLVELVILLYFACDYPFSLLTIQYSLGWITNYNLNHTKPSNISSNLISNDISLNLLQTSDLYIKSISSTNSTKICNNNVTSPDYIFQQLNQQLNSYFLIFRMLVWLIPASIVNLCLGSISDKLGYRWSIIPPLLGMAASCVISTLIVFFKGNIFLFFISDFIMGFGGSFSCLMIGAIFYVINISPNNQLFRITLLQFFLLLGVTISPFATGPLVIAIGEAYTLLLLACVAISNLFYALIFVPFKENPDTVLNENNITNRTDETASYTDNLSESEILLNNEENFHLNESHSEIITKSENYPFEIRSLLKILKNNFKNILSLYINFDSNLINNETKNLSMNDSNQIKCIEIQKSPNIYTIRKYTLLVFLVASIPCFDSNIFTLFEMNSPLCWQTSMITIYTGTAVLIGAVGSLILNPLLGKFLDYLSIAFISSVVLALSRYYVYFVNNTLMMFLSSIFMLFGMLMIPSLKTFMISIVPNNKQGAILGSMASIEIICYLICTVLLNEVYSQTVLINTALVFIVTGSFFTIAGLLIISLKIRIKFSKKKINPTSPSMDDDLLIIT